MTINYAIFRLAYADMLQSLRHSDIAKIGSNSCCFRRSSKSMSLLPYYDIILCQSFALFNLEKIFYAVSLDDVMIHKMR